MSSFEFNKILAAIILAIVVIVIISKVGDIIVDNNKTDLQETAYKIDIPEPDSNIASDATSTSKNIEPPRLRSTCSGVGQFYGPGFPGQGIVIILSCFSGMCTTSYKMIKS